MKRGSLSKRIVEKLTCELENQLAPLFDSPTPWGKNGYNDLAWNTYADMFIQEKEVEREVEQFAQLRHNPWSRTRDI